MPQSLAFDRPATSAAGDVGREGYSGAAARADHVHDRSVETGSAGLFKKDTFTLAGTTGTWTLTYTPATDSLHIYNGAAVMVEGTDYTVSGQTVSVLGGGISGDVLVARYAYVPVNVTNNDAFANAIPLVTVNTYGTALTGQSNAAYSTQSGEPALTQQGSFGAVASAWFTYTATFTGSVVFLLKNATFDAFLDVYTGSAVGSLTPVGGLEAATSAASGKSIAVTNGTTYRIRVSGRQGATVTTGTFDIEWFEHDDVAQASALHATSGSITYEAHGSTKQTSEPTISGFLGSTVWFRIKTGATGGAAQFDTIGTNALDGFDSLIAVYTSSSPSAPTIASLTQIAADDQSGGNNDAKVTPTLSANTDYFIQVCPKYNANVGESRYKFNWSVPSVV